MPAHSTVTIESVVYVSRYLRHTGESVVTSSIFTGLRIRGVKKKVFGVVGEGDGRTRATLPLNSRSSLPPISVFRLNILSFFLLNQ